MTRITKGVLCGLLLSAVFSARIEAQTINATSCNASAVQTALSSVSADGTTVVIPAGNCTWTSTVTYNQVYSTTIQGQTTCTGTPASSCTDNTIITDGVSGNNPVLAVTTASGKSFRLTGMTFTGSAASYAAIRISGLSTAMRLDHINFNNLVQGGYNALEIDNATGVIDHIIATAPVNSEFMRPLAPAWKGVGQSGDNSWADDTGLGGPNFVFLEDSTINGTGATGQATNDCFSGGRYVVRHNVMNNSSVQGHTTGHAGDDRGCRAQEFYLNTLPAPSGGIIAFNAIDLESGSGVVWGNTVANYSNFATAHIKRESSSTYTQTATPNGWGYCGTNQNGTGSNWDQNSIAATGYACLDQVGRGKGDRLSGLFPSKVNTAQGNTIAWARQILEPVYIWGNTWSCPSCGGSFLSIYDAGIVANRDIFSSVGASCSGSSCTSGVGSGLLSARPTSCTANSVSYPPGNSPGVGYWATDTNTLYVCSATNTWTAYYTPYTYPHPLTQGTVSGGPPAPPSAPQITIN